MNTAEFIGVHPLISLGLPRAGALFGIGGGQGARQFTELGLALLLSSLIGLERELQQKSAGLRTHTLVGVGSALFVEVSLHGFGPANGLAGTGFDGSRVAAQIVSGIGFIGGGLIFVRRDAVRGLTTAATIWLTCAVGMACGGGLPLLAAAAAVVHFLVVRGFPLLTRRLTAVPTVERFELLLSYRTRRGVLGRVLELCTSQGFRVTDVHIHSEAREGESGKGKGKGREAEVVLGLEGRKPAHPLVEELTDWEGVLDVGLRAHRDSTE
ncbi:MgtC/SapB family protein [Streptomyces mobaraensis NBRC 13819 = DSM 40847]|uniref:MgtC/SapB transporter n=1 Tax=Streptomyces mobaraensis (strain ATCC 29032 / DSM 40847 / JCM 4168 / NBRC 13819 / NCIMB 11159 / IPCR 16-22) TaxID=1223523 RepID=M3B029_STRM1|nr:MgtC/SapB family protein [Streptomyces mobaraensis]EME99297.1 MgtC/SapB transporter [Streptomyces mobaraensis NBRC 13819 = DSM 40847]QTT73690.1 MgtC/SapB family protein [Streptomyces mobaraensis NBRC 13819 = DSM 40847]